jgi:hypothetical protein
MKEERERHTHTHHVDDDGIRRLCCWTVVEVKADAPPASASNAYPNLIVIIIIYLLYIVTSASLAPSLLNEMPNVIILFPLLKKEQDGEVRVFGGARREEEG